MSAKPDWDPLLKALVPDGVGGHHEVVVVQPDDRDGRLALVPPAKFLSFLLCLLDLTWAAFLHALL